MALTDIQKPSIEDFYNNVRDGAGALYRMSVQVKAQYEFMLRMGVAELDDLAVPAGDIRTDLVQYRTMLGEIVDYFANTAVTPANDPIGVANRIRKMNVI